VDFDVPETIVAVVVPETRKLVDVDVPEVVL
jgi:hypothetical protein